MTIFTHDAVDVFAPTDAAGNPRSVLNGQVQTWGAELQLMALARAAGAVTFGTKAEADLALTYDAWTTAWIIADPVAANNGWYTKFGASGSGSWVRKGDLPYSYIKATNAGDGTANAIVATTASPVPAADGGALIALPIVADTTDSPVTVAFNGDTALTIKSNSGNDISLGGLTAGMIVAGYKIGSDFRLISDLDVSAAVGAAEQAAAEALLSANAAEAAAAGIGTLYADRTAAAAANVPAPVLRIWVAAPSGRTLSYVRDASGTALETADGTKWSPNGDITPDHWAENTMPGTTDMTAAIQAACDHGDYTNVKLLAATYAISDRIHITSKVDSGALSAFQFVGAGRFVTTILQSDNEKDGIYVEKGFGNDLGWMVGTIEGFQVKYDGAWSANAGRGVYLERVLWSRISDIIVESAPNHVFLRNVGVSRFDNILCSNRLIADGANSASVWTLATNSAGRCFNIQISAPEFQNGKSADRVWDIQGVDTLTVNGGHSNNGIKKIHIRPDNSTYQRTIAQVTFSDHYFDDTTSTEDIIYLEFLNPDGGAALTRLEGMYFNQCYFRGATGALMRFGPGVDPVAGLLTMKEVHFSDCDAQDIDGNYILLYNANIVNPTDVIKNFQWLGGTIEDGPNTPKTDNLSAFLLSGKNVLVQGVVVSGGWSDGGSPVVTVTEDTENAAITGNVWDVDRAVPVSINANSVNCRQWGNTRSGGAGGVYVVEVVDEGTNTGGYYRQYADGRLICTKTITTAAADLNTAHGAVYRSASVAGGAMPKNFDAVPVVTGAGGNGAGISWLGMGATGPTASDWGTWCMMSGTSGTGQTHTIMLRAEGFAA